MNNLMNKEVHYFMGINTLFPLFQLPNFDLVNILLFIPRKNGVEPTIDYYFTILSIYVLIYIPSMYCINAH